MEPKKSNMVEQGTQKQGQALKPQLKRNMTEHGIKKTRTGFKTTAEK